MSRWTTSLLWLGNWLPASLRRQRRTFAGMDLEGNRFYESPNPTRPGDPRYTKRTVQYALQKDLEEYNTSALAVHWQSWLRHTRETPPTLQELRADLERREVTSVRAAAYEQAWQEERQQIASAWREKGSDDEAARRIENDARAQESMRNVGLKTSTRVQHAGPRQTLDSGEIPHTPSGHRRAEDAPPPSRSEEEERARKRAEMSKSPLSDYRPASAEEFQPESWKPRARRR